MRSEIIMLGTGYGTAIRRYNACFVLRTDGFTLLTDGGGGGGILRRMVQAGVELDELDAVFVSHTHIDHLFGVVWVLRMIGEEHIGSKSKRKLRVYGHRKVIDTLTHICRATLSEAVWLAIGQFVLFMCVADGECVTESGGVKLTFFDTLDVSEPQYGYKLQLPDGTTLVCLGDSSCKERLRPYVERADWLVCEAFCLSQDEEVFQPQAFHHSTVAQTAQMAQRMAVKHLVIYHIEDATTQRKELYTAEAASEYDGVVYVPEDLENILL